MEKISLTDSESWDFDGARKKALGELARSQISSYQKKKFNARTSDRSNDSVRDLIPEVELQEFTVIGAVLKHPFLQWLIDRRDLLMSLVNCCLLLASILLLAMVQATQPADYNRMIPDKYYTDEYMWWSKLQQTCLQSYVAVLIAYLYTLHLSVRWKLEIDAQMELEKLTKGELIRFT